MESCQGLSKLVFLVILLVLTSCGKKKNVVFIRDLLNNPTQFTECVSNRNICIHSNMEKRFPINIDARINELCIQQEVSLTSEITKSKMMIYGQKGLSYTIWGEHGKLLCFWFIIGKHCDTLYSIQAGVDHNFKN